MTHKKIRREEGGRLEDELQTKEEDREEKRERQKETGRRGYRLITEAQ